MTAQLKAGYPAVAAPSAKGDDQVPNVRLPAHGARIASPTTPLRHSTSTQLRTEPSTAALTTPPPRLPYDCLAHLATWEMSWTEEKKDWCCQHALKGCSDGPPLAAPTTTLSPVADRSMVAPAGSVLAADPSLSAAGEDRFDC